MWIWELSGAMVPGECSGLASGLDKASGVFRLQVVYRMLL